MTKKVQLYKSMYSIRSAESTVASYYMKNKVFSFVHFCIGQEAVASAVAISLEIGDCVFGNHRSHGHYLAKGGDVYAMFSEMLGKSSGSSKGKGGSMHMVDRTVNFLGTSPILSSILPIALGNSWSQMLDKDGNITVAYIGDGASEEGNFYETLNLASLWKLPILIVVENNFHAVNTSLNDRRPENFSWENLCRSFGVEYYEGKTFEIMDFASKSEEAVNYVKSKSRPAVLHAKTLREFAHSAPIKDEQFRTFDTEKFRKENDALFLLRREIIESGEMTLSEIEIFEAVTDQHTIETLSRAAAAELPDSSQLLAGQYA